MACSQEQTRGFPNHNLEPRRNGAWVPALQKGGWPFSMEHSARDICQPVLLSLGLAKAFVGLTCIFI